MMALPSTKTVSKADNSAENIGDRLGSVLRNDLGLNGKKLPAWQCLDEAQVQIVSPTHGVPSTYHIAPVLTRLPAVSHGLVARRLGGMWLSPESALGLDDLSPTARAVFEQLKERDWLPPPIEQSSLLGGESDRALTTRLLAARDGDLKHFWAIMEQIKPALTTRLQRCRKTRLLANRSYDLEDVITDGSLRALKNLEGFNPTLGNAMMWLWTITRNTAIDHIRRNGRTRGLSPEKEKSLMSKPHDPSGILASCEEVKACQSRLENALMNTTPMIRRVWAMRMEEEQPYKNIARELNLPIGTIASWIRRIRQQALAG